jgi:hypothetical protein
VCPGPVAKGRPRRPFVARSTSDSDGWLADRGYARRWPKDQSNFDPTQYALQPVRINQIDKTEKTPTFSVERKGLMLSNPHSSSSAMRYSTGRRRRGH